MVREPGEVLKLVELSPQLVVNMLQVTLWISKTPILMSATSMSTLAWEETSRLLSHHQPVRHLLRSPSLQLALLAPTLQSQETLDSRTAPPSSLVPGLRKTHPQQQSPQLQLP